MSNRGFFSVINALQNIIKDRIFFLHRNWFLNTHPLLRLLAFAFGFAIIEFMQVRVCMLKNIVKY